jgi:hypothetical protein
MFWIGLIVGIVLGVVGVFAVCLYYGNNVWFASSDEFRDAIRAIDVASKNRESTITVEHNGEVIYDVELLER